MSDKVYSNNVEPVESRGDAGAGHRVTCPQCGDAVEVRDFQWWTPTCRCGLVWTVELRAVGEKP